MPMATRWSESGDIIFLWLPLLGPRKWDNRDDAAARYYFVRRCPTASTPHTQKNERGRELKAERKRSRAAVKRREELAFPCSAHSHTRHHGERLPHAILLTPR